MFRSIVNSSSPVTLIGGGAATPADVALAGRFAPRFVAADGGARLALQSGHMPEAVIGDFDSLDAATRAAIPADRLHRIAEQDSTDFDKALRHIAAPLVIAVGFLGARMDHQLAALHVLLRHADRPCILLGEGEAISLAPPQLAVATQPGDIVSLFPLCALTGWSEGLEWELDGLALAPDTRVGTSNAARGAMTLRVSAPGCLLILPRARLEALVTALVAPSLARWPAL